MINYILQGVMIFKWCIPLGIILFIIYEILLIAIKKRQFRNLKNDIVTIVSELLLFIYLCTILWITGIIGREYTFEFSVSSLETFLSIPFYGSSIKMVALNCLLFVPYGFLVFILSRKSPFSFAKIVLIGFSTSLFIEVFQAFTGRLPEIDDIIANTTGFVVGYVVANGMYQVKDIKMRKQGIIKVICTLGLLLISLFCISFFANDDEAYKQLDDYYTQYGFNDENIKLINEFNILNNSSCYTIENDRVNKSNCYYWIGQEISNKASLYKLQDLPTNFEFAQEADKVYIEIKYLEPQTFRFYNNPSWEMLDVTHIVYCMSDGTIWYSSNYNYFEKCAIYDNSQDEYQVNDDLKNEIEELVGLK